jgi:hypothetical protein
MQETKKMLIELPSLVATLSWLMCMQGQGLWAVNYLYMLIGR